MHDVYRALHANRAVALHQLSASTVKLNLFSWNSARNHSETTTVCTLYVIEVYMYRELLAQRSDAWRPIRAIAAVQPAQAPSMLELNRKYALDSSDCTASCEYLTVPATHSPSGTLLKFDRMRFQVSAGRDVKPPQYFLVKTPELW